MGSDNAPESRIVRWSNQTKSIVGALAAIIAFIPLFVAFVIHPFGHEGGGCPGARGAALGPPTVDRSVSRRGYLELVSGSVGSASAEDLHQHGKLIYVPVVLRGLKGKPLQLRWWLLMSDGEPATEPAVRNQLATIITANACTDTAREPVWVPIPKRRGTFIAEIRIVDPNGVELNAVRTPPFEGGVSQ
jgi:hypothetical protein